jgi:hypothetical protein
MEYVDNVDNVEYVEYVALSIGLIIGAVVSFIYLFIATPYRFLKEYYLFNSTHSVFIIKGSIVLLKYVLKESYFY